MAVTKIKGVSSLGGGKYEELVIDGIVTANGDLEVESLDVDGVVTINGKVDSKSFVKVDGVVTLNDKLRAKTVDVDGVVTIHGNVEADEVKIDGVVNAKGQVSADLVESHGVFSAEEVVGDKVIIHCEKRNKHIHNLFGFGRKDADAHSTRIDHAKTLFAIKFHAAAVGIHAAVKQREIRIRPIQRLPQSWRTRRGKEHLHAPLAAAQNCRPRGIRYALFAVKKRSVQIEKQSLDHEFIPPLR